MFERVKRLFSAKERDAELEQRLGELRQRMPVPVFWLFGKTQSGKTTLIKHLTGADDAEIGQGFRPCTRFSRLYQFPTPEAPLLTFLDTRGLDEPDYDPAEDLTRFNSLAHLVIVTVKALDHAQENVLRHLRAVRKIIAGDLGTKSTFTFVREDGTRFDATLARRRISTSASASHRVLPSGMGYIRLTQWTLGATSRAVEAVIWGMPAVNYEIGGRLLRPPGTGAGGPAGQLGAHRPEAALRGAVPASTDRSGSPSRRRGPCRTSSS